MLRIHVLGGLYVTSDGRPLTGAAGQPRRLAMLALLAIAGERGVTRDTLLAYLWPDVDEERGRRALTQALYALRRDLGSDEAFLGMKDLRLNPDMVTSDVAEFRDAASAGDLDRAAAVWRGPFLEGFHLPGSDTFERWVEEQRAGLQHDYTALLDQLAARARERGDTRTAAGWLRKLAATDPLNARVAVRLMQVLAEQGDVSGALQHARVYETLVRQELELPPDREVVALAEQLRQRAMVAGSEGPAGVQPEAVPARPIAPAATVSAAGAIPSTSAPLEEPTIHGDTSGWATMAAPSGIVPSARESQTGPRWAVRIAGVVVGGMLLFAGYRVWQGLRSARAVRAPAERVMAVGRITHYASGGAGTLGEPLADMLATNLARSTGLRVVSNARMVEMGQQLASGSDSGAARGMAAARQAGATELVDGALYELAPGQLRLDLRRVDLASGAVLQAYTVQGGDLFVLADSGTQHLVRDLGATAPSGSLADVSTGSVAAYQAYEAGLRLHFTGDQAGAERRFAEALANDSSFAMAAYYHALSSTARTQAETSRRMELAVRLAAHASDRERLIIQSQWALTNSSPRLAALAETLSVRYPDELDGNYFLGQGANLAGDYPRAVLPLRDVIRRDSLGLAGKATRCLACQAYPALCFAYAAMDSAAKAVDLAEEWTRRQPSQAGSWRYLAAVYATSGRPEAALGIMPRLDSLDPGSAANRALLADVYALTGRYADAEQLLRVEVETGPGDRRREARWDLAVVLRQTGRFREALVEMRRYRRERNEPANRGSVATTALQEAQILFELGRQREAAALFDSIAGYRAISSQDSSATARAKVWAWTHMAAALAAAGDTARLPRLADTLEQLGRISGLGRDRLLHAHLRGLLALARKDDATAARWFRAAINSPVFGYTRSNYELAGVELRLGRPAEAVATLEAALRAGLTGSNLYITRTELRERLAQAFEAAGQPDSAAAQYAQVTEAWVRADPILAERVAAARLKASALRGSH